MGKKRKRRKSAPGRKERRRVQSRNVSTASSLPPDLLSRVRGDPGDLAAALDLADHCARHGFESRISEFLLPHEKRYPFDDSNQGQCFNRLLACGYAGTGRFPQAEALIERALRDDGPSIDIWYLSAAVKSSMREYNGVVEAGRKYIESMEVAEESYRSNFFAATPGRYARLCNIMGQAYAELRQSEMAIDAYQRAIALDVTNHVPYLNLAGLLMKLKRRAEAGEIITQGLQQCRQVQELRMLRESLTERPTISACLMVRDEEELLPGCLDSIRDWVDEIIVVDTGSADRTVAIAGEYGARVFHQPWADDFSKHRNFSIEQATGDWIFIIDADECVVDEDIPLVLNAVNADNYALLSLNVYNVYGEKEDRVTYSNSVRFFKRSLELRYEGVVHNDLILPKDEPILRTRIRLKHFGYDLSPERMKQKFARTKALLEKQLAADPDNTFTLFNYAELLRGVDPIMKPENAEKILRAARRVVALTDPDDPVKRHLHLMCLNQITAAYIHLKKYDQALEYSLRALKMKPNYLDAIMYSGFVYHGMKDYNRAIMQFRKYLETQSGFDGTSEEAPIILSHPDSRDLAYNNLGILYELTGDRRNAEDCYQQGLKINAGFQETASLLGQFYLSDGNDLKAAEFFRHQLDHGKNTVEALLGLASINSRRRQPAEAGRYFRMAVDAFPENPRVYMEFGKFCLESGSEDEAAEAFDRAAELDAGADHLEAEVAEVCFEKGRFEIAADHYGRAIDKYGPASDLLNDLGNCCFKLERYADAEEHYRRACELTPATPLAQRNLGLTQVRLDRPTEAVAAFERYLETSDDEPEIRRLVADQYRKSGDYQSAVSHYEKILASEPQDAAALFGLSEAYLLMGHRGSALLGFQRLLELDPHLEPARDRVRQLTERVRQV